MPRFRSLIGFDVDHGQHIEYTRKDNL